MNTNDRQIIQQTESKNSGKPTDVMRRWLDEKKWKYDYDEGDDIITFNMITRSTELAVLCGGEADDHAAVIVRIPVRVPELTRQAVGEFLHRLNFPMKRKFWGMDVDDGEVRMTAITDLFICQLDQELFGSMVQTLLEIANLVFPYLNGVITRSMKPDFAADQAICALTPVNGE